MPLRYEGGAYWDGEDGPLSDADVAAIRDRRIDEIEDRLGGLAITLLGLSGSGAVLARVYAAVAKAGAIREFSTKFRHEVAKSLTSSYVYAAGGLDGMTQKQWTELTELIAKQDRFAAGFVEAIKADTLSPAQIVARARSYGGAGTEAFERGKAALRHFAAPEAPGQLCAGRSRCRCYWEIVTKSMSLEARWHAKNDANTCEHCAANAVRWNPLIQALTPEEADHPADGEPRPGMGDLDVNDFAKDFANGSQTAANYLEPDGHGGIRFTAERQALHDAIIRDYTAGIPVHAVGDREIHMLGGGGGAGKTTMIKSGKISVPEGGRDAVLVNADEMKDQLPEYIAATAAGDLDAARFAHEESSYLAKRMTRAAIENGQDILIDGVGLNYDKTMKQAGPVGYTVKGHYAYLEDPQTAVDRAIARAAKSGRMVPPDILIKAHQDVSRVFPDVAATLDSVELYNTDSRDPVLVASAEHGVLTVHDPDRYNQFLSIGAGAAAPKPQVDMAAADALGEADTMRVALESTGSRALPSGAATVPEWSNEDYDRYTEDEHYEINNYGRSGWRSLNAALRGTESGGYVMPEERVTEQTTALDSAIAKTDPLPEPIHVARFGKTDFIGLDKQKPGATFTDPGYGSTTVKRDTADQPGELGQTLAGTFGDAVRMDVYVPKGSHVLAIDGLEKGDVVSGEGEVLLPRGTTYRIVEVVPEEKRVVVEVVP